MKTALSATVAALLLAGCQTGYQSSHGGLVAGYDEIKLSDDTYRVSVEGNAYTGPERAKRIVLLRAADLALRDGYERFVVLGGESGARTEADPLVVGFIGHTVIATGGGDMSFPQHSITVRMVKRGTPGYDRALDANLIARQLRPQLS